MADEGVEQRRITARQVIVAFLGLIVILLAVANSQKQRVDLVFGDVNLPLFLIIVGSAVIGWVIGWFMGHSRD